MESATTRNVLYSFLPPPSAASQNYDLQPDGAGEGRGGREGCSSPPLPITRGLKKRCKLPQWGPWQSCGGDVAIYNVL